MFDESSLNEIVAFECEGVVAILYKPLASTFNHLNNNYQNQMV